MFHTFAGHRSSAGRRPGRHSRLGTNSDRGYRILEVTYLIGVSSGSFALSIFGKGLRNLLMNGEQDVNELNFQHSHLYNAKYSSVTVYVLKQTRIWKKILYISYVTNSNQLRFFIITSCLYTQRGRERVQTKRYINVSRPLWASQIFIDILKVNYNAISTKTKLSQRE